MWLDSDRKGPEFWKRGRKVEPARGDVVQRAERRDGLLHPDVQGAHAPGAGASQNARCGGREEGRHVPQTVPQKLPTPFSQDDGQQEHQTEATLHCSPHLVRPVVVDGWGGGLIEIIKKGEGGRETGLRHWEKGNGRGGMCQRIRGWRDKMERGRRWMKRGNQTDLMWVEFGEMGEIKRDRNESGWLGNKGKEREGRGIKSEERKRGKRRKKRRRGEKRCQRRWENTGTENVLDGKKKRKERLQKRGWMSGIKNVWQGCCLVICHWVRGLHNGIKFSRLHCPPFWCRVSLPWT